MILKICRVVECNYAKLFRIDLLSGAGNMKNRIRISIRGPVGSCGFCGPVHLWARYLPIGLGAFERRFESDETLIQKIIV